MNAETHFRVDPAGKWSYRAGGLSALILGIGYLLTFPVITYAGGFPPLGVEAQLAFFAEHWASWWAVTALMVLTDLLYVPVFLALYQVLKGIHKYLMLLALACAFLFVALDLAVTWPAYSSLITLGGSYAAAASDAQRALIAAAAGYPSAMTASPLLTFYPVFIPALGFLFASLVMRKGIFGRTTAYVGLIAGLSGLLAGAVPIFVGALDFAQYINALLATVWFLAVGWRLYKSGQPSPDLPRRDVSRQAQVERLGQP